MSKLILFVRRTIRVGINTNKMINVEKKEMICPRCMGKGFVDLDDIRRLGKKLEWGH